MSFAERCFSSGYFENPVTCPHCHTEFEGPVPDEGEAEQAWIYLKESGLADECNMQHAETLADLVHQLAKTIAELREQTRVRDARVDAPAIGETVLLRVEDEWRTVRLRGWGWSDGNDPADFPYWLPMPPTPEAP